MVISCIAFGCTNRQIFGNQELKFHRSSLRRPDILKQLIIEIFRENWSPTIYCRLCSQHFTKYCYKNSNRLNDVAISTVFNFLEHLQREKKKERRIFKSMKMECDPVDNTENNNFQTNILDNEYLSSTLQNGGSSRFNSVPRFNSVSSPIKAILQKKVKSLQNKLRKREKKNQKHEGFNC